MGENERNEEERNELRNMKEMEKKSSHSIGSTYHVTVMSL